MKPNRTTLPIAKCKRVIACVWFFGAGALFAVLLVQALIGHYGSSQGKIWSWYLSNVSPTIGLIVAVMAAEAIQRDSGTRLVDSFFYRVAIGVSVVYISSLWAIVLMLPLRPDLDNGLPELIDQSGQWLGTLQGLVTASLGVFYVRKHDIADSKVTPRRG